jgi:hypothetical protein
VKSFDELTDKPEWRKELKAVYGGDLEKVDLMTGLFAEPLPEGFGFSETAFRVFILMASRRLKSDRFFTDDYRPEVYTEFGLDYIKKNSMPSVLRTTRLAPALSGGERVPPWKKTTGPRVTKAAHPSDRRSTAWVLGPSAAPAAQDSIAQHFKYGVVGRGTGGCAALDLAVPLVSLPTSCRPPGAGWEKPGHLRAPDRDRPIGITRASGLVELGPQLRDLSCRDHPRHAAPFARSLGMPAVRWICSMHGS